MAVGVDEIDMGGIHDQQRAALYRKKEIIVRLVEVPDVFFGNIFSTGLPGP